MFAAAVLVFLLCVLLVFYTYVGFPLLLAVLAKGKVRSVVSEVKNSDTSVAVIMSVFNEENVIETKLKSILKSDYQGVLSIYIGSDASTDCTAEIVKRFAADDKRIVYIENNTRRGKPAMINDLIELCDSDFFLLTDANVFFEPDTISKLMRNFSDKEIGLVGATILNIGLKKDGISHQEKSYIQRENLIKYREGLLWGTMMGPFGGCYALRKSAYVPVPMHFLVDDFFICMTVLEKKLKCINELEAICYEDVSNDVQQEYRRKARISAGNFQNLKRFISFVGKPFSKVGFCFISHKVLRWLTPFFILLSLCCLVWLSFHQTIFQVLLGGELLLIFSPFIDWLLKKINVHLRVVRFVSYFSLMNIALLKGFFRFIVGVKSGVWTPTKRTF